MIHPWEPPPVGGGGAGWRLVVVWAVLAAGCGYKTAPIPQIVDFPPPAGMKVHQQEEGALVSWKAVDSPPQDEKGALEGFLLRVDQFPFGCVKCPPVAVERIPLGVGQAGLVVEGGEAYYPYKPQTRRAYWAFRVAARYGRGVSDFTPPVFLKGLNDIPAHQLAAAWESAPPAPGSPRGTTPATGATGQPPRGANGLNTPRLVWEPRREQVVKVYHQGQVVMERDRFYRFNLYKRQAGRPWPMVPLNEQPLEVYQWNDYTQTQTVPAVEYTLRLVDQFGGEGPPAPAVSLPSPPGNSLPPPPGDSLLPPE